MITARGTDISLIPEFPIPRYMIRWASSRAKALVAVCQALKNELVSLGAPGNKITVLRNGVDLTVFAPPDNREVLRESLGLSGKVILSVGNLVKLKGHDLIIRALAGLPDVTLLIAGTGSEKMNLMNLAQTEKVTDRVIFLGNIPHSELSRYYGAADLLVLASSREGWANVLLESMACGTPVVATNVWGTPEVVTVYESGLLVKNRTPEDIAAAISCLLLNYPDRVETRRYAEKFSWDETSEGIYNLFLNVSQIGQKI